MSKLPLMLLVEHRTPDGETDPRDDGQWPDNRYDGALNRDPDGGMSISLRHDPQKEKYHRWLLSCIVAADRRPK